ncbi:MAG: hypothetical protein OMM_04365 [Candidatus Magnetoglobus multicellularis str. Araruama]|uniref:FHA domain-containing protein n=1 Tax=Candidatus Magnetoglobus multicellularis str. Araruama TaxID=890399 RepID=A0A1V1P1X9_9BACT|nr:MAG: hypothetical protein OMM_04365 [Candidatus Magnetoglobus multicellularis str. Araruama]
MKKKHIQAIQKASRSLMENKRYFDKLALIGFNDDVFVLSEFTTDSTKFSNAVDKLKTSGQITVLYKGIYMGLKMLDSPELPMLRYMIVISDGKNEGVGFTLDDAIEKAQKINVPIYSMGFVTRKSNAKYLDYLIRLSSKTGGEYQKINHSDDFQSAYRKFGIKIQNQYVIDFLSDVEGDGENHILEIHYMPGLQLKRIARHSFIAPNKINALQKSTFEKTASVEEAVTISTVATTPVNSTKHEAHLSAMFQHLPLIGTLLLLLLLSSFLVWFIIRYHSSKLNTDYNQLNKTTGTPQSENYDLELFIAELDLIKPLISGNIRIGYYDDNHLVLKADTVSGYHAELSGNGCDWIIKDLGSTNGVRVNGKKISDSSLLNENDMIKIGPYELFMRSKT